MNFEHLRSDLSHVLLRPGVFNRLSVPPDLWSDPRKSTEAKIAELVDGWRILGSKPDTLAYVLKVWNGAPSPQNGVPQTVREVFDAAHQGTHWRTTKQFPAWSTVAGWLNDMEAVISQFIRPAHEVADLAPGLLKVFWASSFALLDFVQGMQKGSDRFVEYFERIG